MRDKSPMRLEVVIVALVIIMLDEVIGIIATVAEAGTTTFIGMVIGATTLAGTTAVVVRLRFRLKRPVRAG